VQVRKFVEIKVLDVFEIIETIFDAARQLHAEDEENVGDGWYKCMVSFKDEGEGGVTQTTLQEWYVNSTLVDVNGTRTNRVFVKILEPDDGATRLIRVQIDVSESPTENDDGTLADLGVWDIRAAFGEDDSADDFFHATASVLDDGTARLTVQDQFTENVGGGPGDDGETVIAGSTRAVIFRSEDGGYGVAEYPDWDACFGGPEGGEPEDCSAGPPSVEVRFSYNENFLSVSVDEEVESFDRRDEHEIVHRYQLFNSEDGSNVARETSFGFPVRTEADEFGWYGAWQDRHELWIFGDQAADGTVVTRDDGLNDDPPSYTTRRFDGALSVISLVEGSLDQLEGIPAEIWLFNDFRLIWGDTGGVWNQCVGDDDMGAARRRPTTRRSSRRSSSPAMETRGTSSSTAVWTTAWAASTARSTST